jgi:uncharacterized damage-inducible protein DinB
MDLTGQPPIVLFSRTTINPPLATEPCMPAVSPADPSTAPLALLYPDLHTELAVTRDILARVPWEQADWRPHPKSMTLRALAIHVAQLPGFLTGMTVTDVMDFKPEDFAPPPIASTDELHALFDSESAKTHAVLKGIDWAKLNGTWKMTFGGHTVIDNQRAFLLRHMGISHLVHHRAQLGVYLRLLDVAIPGSYGPSADAQM